MLMFYIQTTHSTIVGKTRLRYRVDNYTVE
jgi:hypothetical protein